MAIPGLPTDDCQLPAAGSYMHRCIELATLGAGDVAPNPMVGAVLVYNNTIIGEGYHQLYGQAHAEVNCIKDAESRLAARYSPADISSILQQSTIYVSLEPCAHFGKTPPCADLIIQKKIAGVVIGCRDPFKEVDGRGIEKLVAAGVKVHTGVLEKECRELNKRFFTVHTLHRPYIILKWAQSIDGHIGHADHGRVLISNEFTNRLVHKWRSEEAAIMVGTNTALFDDPALTTRLWKGHNPVRLVIDMRLRLPSTLQLFDGNTKTIVFNTIRHEEKENLLFYQVTEDVSIVHQVLNALYQLRIQSVLIEGGTKLLQSFIDEGMWDEARVIVNEQLHIAEGKAAPQLGNPVLIKEEKIAGDRLFYYTP